MFISEEKRGGRGCCLRDPSIHPRPHMLESPECTRAQCVAHTLCPSQKFFSFQNQLNLAQPWLHFASQSPNSGCHLQMRSTPQIHLSWAFTLFLSHFCTHMPTTYYIPPDGSPCKACSSTAFHLSKHTYHLPDLTLCTLCSL